MKTKEKPKSGSVKVDPEVLALAKKMCKEKGWLVSTFITNATRIHIGRYNKAKDA